MSDDSTIELNGATIAVDDRVQVIHSPGKRDGFIGKVLGWWVSTVDGSITAVDVWGGKSGYEKARSIRPERIQPIEQVERKNR